MENLILKPEWVKAIAILPEPSDFLLALLNYRLSRQRTFKFPTESALFTAIQDEFDKLNFSLDDGFKHAFDSCVSTGNIEQ